MIAAIANTAVAVLVAAIWAGAGAVMLCRLAQKEPRQ